MTRKTETSLVLASKMAHDVDSIIVHGVSTVANESPPWLGARAPTVVIEDIDNVVDDGVYDDTEMAWGSVCDAVDTATDVALWNAIRDDEVGP